MGKRFVGERRVIATVVASVLTYVIVRFVFMLEISDTDLKVLGLSAGLGAVISKWVHARLR